MKNNYLQLLSNRDHLLMLEGIYYDALKRKEEEDDELTHELEVTMNSLRSTQIALQESETRIDEFTVELILVQSSSPTTTIQVPMAAIDDEHTSMDCGNVHIEDVETSISFTSVGDTNGMSALDEHKREQFVAIGVPEDEPISSDANNVIDKSCDEEVDFVESGVFDHNAAPSFL